MFARLTIQLVLLLIILGAANSLKCQECSVNGYHTNCRAGTIEEPSECSPDEDSCYTAFVYGSVNNYVPEYKRGCARSDYCDEEHEELESDLQVCYMCQEDMCNNEPMEDDIGSQHSGPLYCQSCNDNDVNSDCRMGKIEDRHQCGKEEDMCYEEYLITDGTPLYKRGCATSDWCSKENEEHDLDVKICKTCPEHMCNNNTLGSSDSSKLQCWTCQSEDKNNVCSLGVNLTLENCEGSANRCQASYLFSKKIESWRRGCTTDDYCKDLKVVYGVAYNKCYLCELDLCNNHYIPPNGPTRFLF